jgi:hypothetical protein
MNLRYLAARAIYSHGPVCFACGTRGEKPCSGHEYGGVIYGWRVRALLRPLPTVLYGWADPRAGLGGAR